MRTKTKAPRHKHVWRYHSSQYNEPITDNWQMVMHTTYSSDEREKLLHGFTNITYVCADETCTEVLIDAVAGKVADPHFGKPYVPEKVEKQASDAVLKKP